MKERNDYAAAPPGFGDAADELWRAIIEGAARRYAVAAAVALDLPRDFFAASLAALDQCTLRFLHYPALRRGTGSARARASTRTLASSRSSSSATARRASR